MREPRFQQRGRARLRSFVSKALRIQLIFCLRIKYADPAHVAIYFWQRSGLNKSLCIAHSTTARFRCRQHSYRSIDDRGSEHTRQAVVSLRKSHGRVSLITRETFITAISIQSDRHVFSRFARHVVGRNGGRVGVRLAVVFDERG